MSSKLIYMYFHKYLKPEYNFHGLILKPNYLPMDNKILWSIENPNDISYSETAINDFVQDLVDNFSRLISDKSFFEKNWRNLSKLDIVPGFYYLNSKDKQKLDNGLKSINEIKIKKIRCEVECIWYDINVSGNEIIIEVGMKFMKCYMNNWNEPLDKKDLPKLYKKLVLDDDFLDYEYTLFNPLISVLFDNPAFYSHYYTFFTTNIYPYNADGTKLKTEPTF